MKTEQAAIQNIDKYKIPYNNTRSEPGSIEISMWPIFPQALASLQLTYLQTNSYMKKSFDLQK